MMEELKMLACHLKILFSEQRCQFPVKLVKEMQSRSDLLGPMHISLKLQRQLLLDCPSQKKK